MTSCLDRTSGECCSDMTEKRGGTCFQLNKHDMDLLGKDEWTSRLKTAGASEEVSKLDTSSVYEAWSGCMDTKYIGVDILKGEFCGNGVSFPWKCIGDTCVDADHDAFLPESVTSQHNTQAACQSACQGAPTRWKCGEDQVCQEGTGTEYTLESLAACQSACKKASCPALVDFFKEHFAKDLKIDCTDCNLLDVIAMMAQGDTETAYTCAETRGADTTRTFSNLFGFEEEYPLLWLFLTMFVILLSFND